MINNNNNKATDARSLDTHFANFTNSEFYSADQLVVSGKLFKRKELLKDGNLNSSAFPEGYVTFGSGSVPTREMFTPRTQQLFFKSDLSTTENNNFLTRQAKENLENDLPKIPAYFNEADTKIINSLNSSLDVEIKENFLQNLSEGRPSETMMQRTLLELYNNHRTQYEELKASILEPEYEGNKMFFPNVLELLRIGLNTECELECLLNISFLDLEIKDMELHSSIEKGGVESDLLALATPIAKKIGFSAVIIPLLKTTAPLLIGTFLGILSYSSCLTKGVALSKLIQKSFEE